LHQIETPAGEDSPEAPVTAERERLHHAFAAVPISDPDGLFDGRDEDFAIPYFARPGGYGDDLDDSTCIGIGNHYDYVDLGQEFHLIFLAAIGLRVALLPAMATHIGYGYAFHANAFEGFFHFVEFVRLYDRFDLLHAFTILVRKNL
jgi:hypothetical protein